MCAFNPIYGQGMTVAALQANALQTLLDKHFQAVTDLPRISRAAQKAVAGIAHEGWSVSATQDLRYPVTGGPSFGIRLLHRYMDAMLLAATVDEGIATTFLNVLNMTESAAALRRPTTMLRVLRQARRDSQAPAVRIACRVPFLRLMSRHGGRTPDPPTPAHRGGDGRRRRRTGRLRR